MSETIAPADPVEIDAPVDMADKPREPTPYEVRLRKEAAATRAKLRETEAKLATDIAAAQAAAEQRIAETQRAANERIIRAELKAAALKAGMVDLDGLKLADLSAVKLTESGDVEGADALMETLKTTKPYLFGAAKTGSTATPPAVQPPAAKTAKEMTRDEWKAARNNMLARR